MAEALKHMLNPTVIAQMADHFKKHDATFNKKEFIADSTLGFDELELKQRTTRICDTMKQYLPSDFKKSATILLSSLAPAIEKESLSIGKTDARGIAGWPIMCLAQYVALYGQEHFDCSMNLFKELTQRASAEFGIRFFILAFPKKTLAVLKKWTNDSNLHVRRLVSEGSRPRLPWAMRLPIFIEDPSPVLALLDRLKDDESEYVRRSVANNLNDIAKDHPDLVATIAKQWLVGADKNREKLIRHACRTLIKNGHKKTLKALGYQPAALETASLLLHTPRVIFGQHLDFTLTLSSKNQKPQALLIDYVIHHQKANGTLTPKVFKWRSFSISKDKTITISKKHSIRPITTRAYYEGLHKLEIMINGISVAQSDFVLSIP